MSQQPLHNFNPSTAVQYQLGILSSPAREARDQRVSPATLPNLLTKMGAESFDDLAQKREQAKPVAFAKVDDFGALNIHNVRRGEMIRNFFTVSSFQPHEDQKEYGAKHPHSSLDVRSLGGCLLGPEGEALEFYSCRCELTQAEGRRRKPLAMLSALQGAAPTIAIPASPHSNPLEALSMINPLRMNSLELVNEDAGAIFCFSPSTFGCVARLYWSEAAFMKSLNRVQAIGSALIGKRAIEYAAEKGQGISRFDEGSALLAQLYESVAVLGHHREPLFITAGIWGVAVKPQTHGYYLCQLGIVAVEIEPVSSQDATSELQLVTPNPSKRHFVVANFIVTRDQFGFVDILPEKYERYPVQPLAWYDSLPSLTDE
jgi:hypothetical protein